MPPTTDTITQAAFLVILLHSGCCIASVILKSPKLIDIKAEGNSPAPTESRHCLYKIISNAIKEGRSLGPEDLQIALNAVSLDHMPKGWEQLGAGSGGTDQAEKGMGARHDAGEMQGGPSTASSGGAGGGAARKRRCGEMLLDDHEGDETD
ncbi:hypothetical protein F5883DRAFT_646241 [Diaporthe sp. PMI_573]|nr:hypothetical protein F5883DRAFT_646241 [Diaporthaceae sp. PMI_573]